MGFVASPVADVVERLTSLVAPSGTWRCGDSSVGRLSDGRGCPGGAASGTLLPWRRSQSAFSAHVQQPAQRRCRSGERCIADV